jgi:hypothetical protein
MLVGMQAGATSGKKFGGFFTLKTQTVIPCWTLSNLYEMPEL